MTNTPRVPNITIKKVIKNSIFELLKEQNCNTIAFAQIIICFGNRHKNQINLNIDVYTNKDGIDQLIYTFDYLCSPEIHILEDKIKEAYKNGGYFLNIVDGDKKTTFNFKVTKKVKKHMIKKLAQYRSIASIDFKDGNNNRGSSFFSSSKGYSYWNIFTRYFLKKSLVSMTKLFKCFHHNSFFLIIRGNTNHLY